MLSPLFNRWLTPLLAPSQVTSDLIKLSHIFQIKSIFHLAMIYLVCFVLWTMTVDSARYHRLATVDGARTPHPTHSASTSVATHDSAPSTSATETHFHTNFPTPIAYANDWTPFTCLTNNPEFGCSTFACRRPIHFVSHCAHCFSSLVANSAFHHMLSSQVKRNNAVLGCHMQLVHDSQWR